MRSENRCTRRERLLLQGEKNRINSQHTRSNGSPMETTKHFEIEFTASLFTRPNPIRVDNESAIRSV